MYDVTQHGGACAKDTGLLGSFLLGERFSNSKRVELGAVGGALERAGGHHEEHVARHEAVQHLGHRSVVVLVEERPARQGALRRIQLCARDSGGVRASRCRVTTASELGECVRPVARPG